eukprot:Rhum_TRINITY_DN15503_c0_g1::Rhum_TRINITY_DN15503_c0_g1_i1::g.160878::m.160878
MVRVPTTARWGWEGRGGGSDLEQRRDSVDKHPSRLLHCIRRRRKRLRSEELVDFLADNADEHGSLAARTREAEHTVEKHILREVRRPRLQAQVRGLLPAEEQQLHRRHERRLCHQRVPHLTKAHLREVHHELVARQRRAQAAGAPRVLLVVQRLVVHHAELARAQRHKHRHALHRTGHVGVQTRHDCAPRHRLVARLPLRVRRKPVGDGEAEAADVLQVHVAQLPHLHERAVRQRVRVDELPPRPLVRQPLPLAEDERLRDRVAADVRVALPPHLVRPGLLLARRSPRHERDGEHALRRREHRSHRGRQRAAPQRRAVQQNLAEVRVDGHVRKVEAEGGDEAAR